MGHKSLLDCYVDRHASICELCKKEAVYAFEQTKKGKTPGEIRADIISGKWTTVKLSSYKKPVPQS